MLCFNGFELYSRWVPLYIKTLKSNQFLQGITGEELNIGAKAPDAQMDIVARGIWERQRSVFFDVRVCYPNADSYRDLDPDQTFRQQCKKQRRSASTLAQC